jgi:hypothetical protein
MINIAQLRLQLVAKDGLPALENHASGIGQQQLATVADQQRAVQLIFRFLSILLMVGCVTNSFSAARVKLAGEPLRQNNAAFGYP